MKTIIKFMLFTSLCATYPLFAGEIFDYPPSEINQSIFLVKEFLNGTSRQRPNIHSRLIDLDPRGVAFVDRALALLVDDPSPWKAEGEPRATILTFVVTSLHDFEPAMGFEDSDIKRSIHKSAQTLLNKTLILKERQYDIVRIYNRLQLWDESDLHFLTRIFFGGTRINSLTSAFLRLFEQGSQGLKTEFAARVRGSHSKDLLGYAMLYRFGLLEDDEVIKLLRLFKSDISRGTAYESERAKSFLNEVLLDLHTRLRQGDARILIPYEKVRASLGLAKGRTNPKLESEKQFLRDLWTGRNIVSCEATLTPVPKSSELSE